MRKQLGGATTIKKEEQGITTARNNRNSVNNLRLPDIHPQSPANATLDPRPATLNHAASQPNMNKRDKVRAPTPHSDSSLSGMDE